MTWTVRPRFRWSMALSLLVACGVAASSPLHTAHAAADAGSFVLTHRVQIAPGDVVLGDAPASLGAGLTTIALRGAARATDLGTPAIPELPVTLVIPADRSVVRVRAIVESEQDIARDVTVAPVMEAGPAGLRVDPVRPTWKQGAVAEARGEGYLRGYKLASFIVRPVRYANGRVSVTTSVRLEVELGARRDDGPVALSRERAETSQQVAGMVRRLVANPSAVSDGWRAAQPNAVRDRGEAYIPTFRPTTDGSAVDYVIVTVDSLVPAFQTFADWKTQLGLQTVVRSVSWITANYPGGADRAETIRTFIRDAYQNWGTTFVLLGGDAPVVPYRAGKTTYYGSEDIPADLYFQCLDGNWNADGDSLYGEGFTDSLVTPGDYCDLYPEVFIGRAPVNSIAEVNTWFSKNKQFAESAPADFATKVLFASEVLFPSTWTTPGQPISLDGATLTQDPYNMLPASITADRLYQNYTQWPGSVQETKQETINRLNSGYMFVEHMGHGYRNTLSVGDNVLTNPDIDGLTNTLRQGIVYSVNCNSASFEFNSISERFMIDSNGGACAYIGATRYDFPTTVWGYQNQFFSSLFQDSVYTLGQAEDLSKTPFVPFSVTDNSHRWTQFAIVLLGDPSMDVYWRSPRTFSVSVPPITIGQGSVTITVTAGGVAVPGVTVTLSKANDAYARGVTDGAGQVTLAFNPSTTGSMTVGVYSKSDYAKITTVNVLSSLPPYLDAQAITVRDGITGLGSGNADGVANPSETIDLLVPLKNTGGSVSSSVTASFATSDPYVTISDSTSTYATVISNQTINGDGFVFAIDALTPDQHVVSGTLTVRDFAGHVWQNPLVVNVGAARPVIVTRTVRDTIIGDGDGVPETGETVAYQLKLQNLGGGAAHDLTLHASPITFNVDLQDSLQVFATDVPANGGTGAGNDWFRYQVFAGGIQKFMVWATDPSGREYFRQPVDLSAPGQPLNLDALGSSTDISLLWTAVGSTDLYGYNVYRSTDSLAGYVKVNNYIDIRTAYYKDEGLPPFARYYYKVASVDSSGNESILSRYISSTTNPPIHAGFPVDLGRGTPSSPVIGDIDGDGVLDIAVGADRVYALHADGTELRDGDLEPRTLGIWANVGVYFAASVGLDDLDHDGHIDVVAASFNSAPSPQDTTTIWVFDGVTGATKPGWPHAYPKFGWATPAIGDIDGDGFNEIVTASSDGWLYAWNGDGTNVRTVDLTVSGRFFDMNPGASFTYTSPALADIDHDGKMEVVIGASGIGGTTKLHVLNEDGTEVAGFPTTYGGGISSSPAIADLDNNGTLEIVFGTADNQFHCVNETGGPDKWTRFFQQFGSSRTPSPAIGDINKDGILDVVTAATGGSPTPKVYAMRGDNGGDIFTPVFYGTGTTSVSECSPILTDLNGDTFPDILQGAENGNLYGWLHNGQPAPGFPISLPGEVRSSPLAWDIDNDGLTEIVYAGWDATLYAWDLPTPFAQSSSPWPMFHHDVRHTGLVTTPFLTAVGDNVAPGLDAAVLSLAPSAPNPWRGVTTISFVVPASQANAQATLRVFDASGRGVATLVNGPISAGRHDLTWSGWTDATGERARSGVYFYRLQVGDAVLTRRTVILP